MGIDNCIDLIIIQVIKIFILTEITCLTRTTSLTTVDSGL